MKLPRTLFLFPFYVLLFAVTSQTAFAQAKSGERFTQVTDASFAEDIRRSDRPVLILFWNESCGACKLTVSVLESVADDYDGKLKIVLMNVDENTDTPANIGVRIIPTLMLLKGGEVVAAKEGAVTKEQLTAFLNEHL